MVEDEITRIAAVEQFYRAEGLLLQGARYEDWLQLFTPDVRYRMATVSVLDNPEDMVSREGELAYFDDDFESLSLRVQRLSTNKAWTEIPPSRTRYFVQVQSVESDGGDGVVALSNFLVVQRRRLSEENLFVGGRRDHLVRHGTSWRIASRLIDPDQAVLQAKNLAVFL